jgi:hypothetical protein
MKIRFEIERVRGNSGEAVHENLLERFITTSAREGGSRRLLHVSSEQRNRKWIGESYSIESQL